MRPLLVAVMVVCGPLRSQPARWWRSQDARVQLHLTRAECDEIDRAYQRSLPAQCAASLEATRALAAISQQLDDGFQEETLLALTERLASAQTREQTVQHDLSRAAHALCARRHTPEWLVTQVAR
jgi:hypothetical protein